LEVIMLTRRTVLSACALCVAIPTAASASAATDALKAKGPHGITTTTEPQDASGANAHPGDVSRRDGMSDWRPAVISEAALLAALALGSALLLTARRRAPSLGT
jgi:hypothetical protein